MKRCLIVLVAASGGNVACKSSDPPEVRPATPEVDVTTLATEHAVQALHFGTVSIDVPKTMKRDVQMDIKVVWYFDGSPDAPRISLESGTRATHTRVVTTPAQRLRTLITAMEDVRTMQPSTQRELADGALATFERPDHSSLRVFVDRWREGWWVSCEVMVARSGAIPRFDAVKAWAEQTCLTAKIDSLKPL